MKKVIWIVLDSVGVGEMPDSQEYGDKDVNTLVNVYNYNKGLNLPNMKKLGLYNIDGIEIDDKEENPIGSYAKLAELSKGKDTTTGHWEMVGLHTKVALPTYPNGFPDEILEPFKKAINRGVLGNISSSGTKILDDLGEEHMKTGDVIVYTSADSVFQIAAHEEVVPIDELYKICKIARELLVGEHEVARVIARPFVGEPTNFTRTSNRHDYAVIPPETNLLDYAKKAGIEVVGVGKIEDIFAGSGVTKSFHTKSNKEGMDITIKLTKEMDKGIIFTNLVDFDMKWGHRNDPEGSCSFF
ncbi:MAG: phosphopentomutase [Epulopiscium sp. Nele67-Bin004]|nr:MAG: phosphopentomutase [Epulopiscium sp. Nele67-Bin004]